MHQDAYHSPTCSTKYSLHLPIFYLSIEGTPWSLAGDSSTTKPEQPQTEILPIKLNTSGDLQNKVGIQPWLLGHPLPAAPLLTILVKTQGLVLVRNCTIPKRITGDNGLWCPLVSGAIAQGGRTPANLLNGTGNWFNPTSFWDKAKATGPESAKHHNYWTLLQLLQWIQNWPGFPPKQDGVWMVQV